jgi:hypothetical protein
MFFPEPLSPSGPLINDRQTFALKAEGNDMDLTGLVIPVTVGLTIGDETGQTTVVVRFESALSRRNNLRWPTHGKIAA